MKSKILFTAIYIALALISLTYAAYAFIDTDLNVFTTDVDLFKLFSGTGTAFLWLHCIYKLHNSK